MEQKTDPGEGDLRTWQQGLGVVLMEPVWAHPSVRKGLSSICVQSGVGQELQAWSGASSSEEKGHEVKMRAQGPSMACWTWVERRLGIPGTHRLTLGFLCVWCTLAVGCRSGLRVTGEPTQASPQCP